MKVDRANGGAPPQESRSLAGAFARGSAWSLLGYGGSQIVRFASNLVLWRLLYAEAFGVMAIVNVFLQALTMFSDIGIGPSIIQSKRGVDPDWLNTAWTLQVLRGVCIWAVACALAGPVAGFYEEPTLATYIPVAAATAVLQGFNSSKLFTEQRKVALGRITLIDLCSHVLGSFFTIVWAYFSPSIWALVAGSLFSAFLRLTLTHLALDGTRNRLRWDPIAARSILGFGRWIFISTLLNFVAVQSDRLIFGKLVSMATLGVYSIAQIWATLPPFLLGNIVHRALFPVLSMKHNDGLPLRPTFRDLRLPVLLVAGWVVACLTAGGPTLIAFLYDERARDAGWIIQLLSVGSWFLALEAVNGSALLASGRPAWLAGANAAKVVAMILLIAVGHHAFGFAGAVAGFAVAESFKYAVSAVATQRLGVSAADQDLLLTIVVLAGTGLGWVARSIARALGLPLLFEGIAIFLVVTVLFGGIFLRVRRRRAERRVSVPSTAIDEGEQSTAPSL